jgi:hypothetical protein
MLSTIEEIIRDLLIFVAVMAALLIILIVVVSKMPSDNPLKRVLTALCYRIGATAAAGALAVPVEPIPGLDALYDIGAPILLVWYWFTFFRDAGRAMSQPPAPPPGQERRCPTNQLRWRRNFATVKQASHQSARTPPPPARSCDCSRHDWCRAGRARRRL